MNREQLLAALRPDIMAVDIPGKGQFHVRSFDGHSRAAWYNHVTSNTDPATDKVVDMVGLVSTLLLLTVCDESGALLFGPDDAAALSALDSRCLDDLYKAAAKLNKLTREDADLAGDTFPQ